MAVAKDIMTPKPLIVGSGTDIIDVAKFFLEHHVSSAPVQNPLGEIFGHLTELELVKAVVLRKSSTNTEQSKVFHLKDNLDPVTFVNEDDHVSEVLKNLLKSPSHRVLVINAKKKIVGIISPKDLLRSLLSDGPQAETITQELRRLQEEVADLKNQMFEMTQFLQTYDSVFLSGIYMLHSSDKNGKILFCNEKMNETLGYEPGELLGKSIFDIYVPSVHNEVKQGLGKIMIEGKHNLTYSSMVTKKGEIFRVELASSAIKDSSGRYVATFTISRKIESEALLRSLHGIFERQSQNKYTQDDPKDPKE